MFKSQERRVWSSGMAKGKTIFAGMLCVLTLSLWQVPDADGKPVPWGNWRPQDLQLLCQNEGGVYGPPSSTGGVYYCLLPDGTLYTCGSDGTCTKDVPASVSRGSNIQDQLDLFGSKQDLINVKLDRLTTQLTALQEFLVNGVAPMPDLLPVPIPATSGPAAYCRRDDQGRLQVQILNQGAADAGETMTRVEFGCGNTQLCNAPTQVDASTPALTKLGGIAELIFNIPQSCFSPSTNNCTFQIQADYGSAVVEGNESNNIASGTCGPQFQ